MEQKAERIERELAFQKEQVQHVADVEATPPEVVARYRRLRHWRIFAKEYLYRALGDLRGQRILDFGCGTGEITTQLALLGAGRVTGFDLSPDLVAIARRRAELDGVSDRVELKVADGEEITLPPESFDAVVLFALLHHTEIPPVLDHALAALKPGGRCFVMEPVAFSAALQRLRDRMPVPKVVSPDERQLTLEDVEAIRSRFRASRVVYFNGLGRLQRLFLGDPPTRTGRLTWLATCAVHYVDRALFRIPGFWRAAGTVLIVGEKGAAGRTQPRGPRHRSADKRRARPTVWPGMLPASAAS